MSSSPCLASHWIASFLPDTQPSHFIVALFSNRSLFELDFSLVHRIFFFSANLGKGLDGWSWSTFVIHHFHFSHNTPCLPPPPPPKKKKKIFFTHFATVVISRKNKKNKGYAKFWVTNKVYYGRCANGQRSNPGQLWNYEAENRGASITRNIHLFGPRSAITWVIKSLKNCYRYPLVSLLWLTYFN